MENLKQITVIKYSALQTLGCERKHSLRYQVSLRGGAVENKQRPAISTIDQTASYQLTWFPCFGISACWEKSACVRACMRARVALLPLGWDINKVTVQLESGCIHSRAPYKADGDASDLKKGENSKGSRLGKYVVTSVTILQLQHGHGVLYINLANSLLSRGKKDKKVGRGLAKSVNTRERK